MATMAPKADKLTIVYSILAKTKLDHLGAQTNHTKSKLSDTPPLMDSGLPIVLMLYTGTDNEPVNYRNIGIGPNIPVFRNRLQRILNRATQEASIHLLCSVTTEDKPSAGFKTSKSQSLWSKGLINPITKKIPQALNQELLVEGEKTECRPM